MPSGLHFNKTGSNIVEKCQQVSRSQSLLQHTWLALQLSESLFSLELEKRDFYHLKENLESQSKQALRLC